MRDLIIRIASAVVALAIVIPIIVFGELQGVQGLLWLIGIIGMLEYAKMAFGDDFKKALGVFFAGGMATYALVLYGRVEHYPLCVAALAMVSLSWAVTRSWEPKEALERAGRMWIGWVYVPLIAWIGVLVSMQQPGVPWLEQEGLGWLFFCMICVFAGDSGGYLAGRAFGKTKLAPSVSPKKTWEGVAGGVLLAVLLASWFWYGVLEARASVDLAFVELVGLVVLIVAAGIVGDLCESLLKRAYGVKDTGRIMPGHGGVLDRLDSLMFAVPVLISFLRVAG